MSTFGRLKRHSRQTMWAILCRRRSRGRWSWLLHTVKLFNQNEYREGDDQEIDHVVKEHAVVQGCRARRQRANRRWPSSKLR